MFGSCKQRTKQTADNNTQDTLSVIEETVYNQIVENDSLSNQIIDYSHLTNPTVEDTVRYQIGDRLFFERGIAPFSSSDSITVIKAYHSLFKEAYQKLFDVTHYREYHFIVHNRHTRAHSFFESSLFDKEYHTDYFLNTYEQVHRPMFDTIPTKLIDPIIKDFVGHWVYLTEHNGNYYLNNRWNFNASFNVTDSMFYWHYMDGPDPRKIIEAVPLPENKGISLVFTWDNMKIEVVDKEKSVYRSFQSFNQQFYVAPARAIHNFEIIEGANNTGELM